MAYPTHPKMYVLLKVDDCYGSKMISQSIAVSDSKQKLLEEKEQLERKDQALGYQINHRYQIDNGVKRL